MPGHVESSAAPAARTLGHHGTPVDARTAAPVADAVAAPRSATGARRAAMRLAASRPLLPGIAAAHPLGNFTINHYAGDPRRARSGPARRRDRPGRDPGVPGALRLRHRRRWCCRTRRSTPVVRPPATGWPSRSRCSSWEARALTPRLTSAGLSFPPGVGGLSTMREVCSFEHRCRRRSRIAPWITFVDRSFAERTGWREIVAQGSGVTLSADDGELRQTSVSQRLTRLPAGSDRAAAPGPVARTACHRGRRDPGSARVPGRLPGPAVDPAPPATATSPAAVVARHQRPRPRRIRSRPPCREASRPRTCRTSSARPT